jgi:acyl-CoA synthetase (AMP-forming)/AMP-acid ligase II
VSREVLNIAAHLPAMARERPDAPAVVFAGSGEGWSFARLDEESDRVARGLDAVGVKRGVRTALMVPPGPDFFALTFALFKAGAVPVVVDPGMGVKNLGRCLAEAEPEAFIGVPKAQAARLLFGWARRTLRLHITVGRTRAFGGLTLDRVRARAGSPASFGVAPTRAGETAAILFTSGSTGVPKGAVYTHGVFAAQVALLQEVYGIEPGEIDLATFPLFALFDPALGMTAIIPEMDFTRPGRVDPEKILAPIRRYGVTNLFGSPALIDRVSRHGVTVGARLDTLRRVISAGAPVSPKVLTRMTRMLADGVQVFTPYGATEALPVASIGSDEILGETALDTAAGRGVCVGRPVPGVTVRIIRITDEPIASWRDGLALPTGEIGEVAVQGPVVTRVYFNRTDSTRLAKIQGPDADDFYHRMGDLGYLDRRGRLWFCGRKSHRVQAPDVTFFTIPCEGVFNAHPDVYRSALVGVGPAGAARPVLCVELENARPPADRARVKRELLELAARQDHTRSIDTVLFHRRFPVDVRHNAKIFREKLAVWAAGRAR